MLDSTTVAAHFLDSLAQAQLAPLPYKHWFLSNMLPADVVKDIVALPVAPAAIEDTQGRRETHNSERRFFGTAEQPNKPVRATVQVAHLAAPGAMIEVMVTAVRSKKK